MRRHGWQLPYHPLQIVAVAVFFALVFAFYVFFIPFVGSKILEVVVIVLYSPTVVVVFALYVWCVAINPADEGLLISKKCNAPSCSESKPAPSMLSSRVDGKELELACGKGADRCPTLEEAGAEKWTKQKDARSCWAFAFFTLIQSYLCKSETYLPSNQADMLYCSLCKVEISKDSKHCRVCDKCIDGFDHHCRWLNNCVGRKNYKDFVALMVSGIAMLILQWSVGLWVLIHCFLSFSHCQSMIISKLGSSFSPVAYIIVVALCTLLAMAATYPLGQLFFFHMLLIKKGISTYDYIVAMREQVQKGVGDAAQSPLTSPVSSVGTVNSGGSSAGALQGRAWCTPPRFFVDHEQGVYPPERSFSVKGMSSGLPAGPEFDRRKPVKLSTWALASLNKDDVLRATTIAKKKSSILLPVASSTERTTVQDVNYRISSSKDASTELCPSLANRSASTRAAEVHLNLADQSAPVSFMERGKFPVMSFDGSGSDSGDVIQLSRKARKALNPLQMEAMNAFKTSHSFSNDGMTVSSPESIGASSEPQHFPDNELDVFELPHYSVVPTDWQYNVQGIGSSPSDTDGGLSSSCTPIRQVLYAAHEGSL